MKREPRSSLRGSLQRSMLFCLLCWLTLAGAQAAQRFGQDRGLPSQTIEALALDERGFLWVGTIDGLVRFDSHRFLPVDLGYGRALADPKVTRLLALPGAVYVAAPRRLHRFDQGSETLAPVQADGEDIIGVIGLAQDHDGSVLAITDAGILYRWRDATTPQPQQVALKSDVALPTVATLAAGRDAIWLGTYRGVYRIDRVTLKVEFLTLDLPEIEHGAVRVWALNEDRAGELWIGFWLDGLARYEPRTGRARRILPGQPEAGALRSNSIYRFLESDDELLIGTNRGLVRYRRDCDCFRGLNPPEWDRLEGRGVIVADLAREPGGAIWAGSWGTGLVRFSNVDRAIERQVPVDGRADALAHPMVTALRAEADGRLWVGSYGGGLQWVDPSTRRVGEFWPLSSLSWGERRVESRFIWALDRIDDELRIGTGHGLLSWSERDARLRDIDADLASVRSLLDLGDGTRLIGTIFGLYREREGRLERVELTHSAELPAAAQAIWSLARWDDEIWAGSANGLWRLSPDLAVRAWHDVGTEDTELPGPVVWTQKADAQGRRWLGTSGGLVQARHEGAVWRFERHARAEGGGSQSVGSIEFDARGQLWLGTPRGLVRYRPEQNERRLFTTSDGLVGDQLNTNASTHDGERLYFGGSGGLIAFDPLAIPEPDTALKPQVTQWRLGQEAWQAPRALSLSHDHPSLHVELSAHYFEHPDRVRYAYRWSPGEAAFTELGDARSAVFSRLPDGRHQLELRATLVDDPSVSAIATSIEVEVLPAWHQTWWGRAALLLGLASLAYAVFAVRSRQIRQQAQALAREVRERTHELSAAKDALELANTQLQRQAGTDPLTGLDNRRRLFEIAAQWQAEGRRLAALLIDLDHFKRINDEHGHQIGDAVLADFATVMREVFGERTCCSRYGGEEFLALLDAERESLDTLAQQLLQRVRTRQVATRGALALGYTASIGVAHGAVGENIEALIRRADQALYRAKEAGRDRYEIG
jgi:diguanylate cyclase (GGDEF)-like protein